MRLLAGLLLLTPFLLGVAQAQVPAVPSTPATETTVSGYLDDPGHPLAPGANESIVMHVQYTPGKGAAPDVQRDPNDPTNSGQAPVAITFAPKDKPTWVQNVTFRPAQLNLSWTAGGTPAAATVEVILAIARDAPAGNHQNLSVAIHAEHDGTAPATDGMANDLMLRPGNAPSVSVKPQAMGQALVKGGRAIPITYLVTNTGNGRVTAQLNVTARPQDSIVDLPATITLDPGQTLPVDVMLQLPWTYGESGTLTLEATPLAGEGSDEQGKAVQANVDIAGESAVPGVGLAALVAVGLGVALVRRR